MLAPAVLLAPLGGCDYGEDRTSRLDEVRETMKEDDGDTAPRRQSRQRRDERAAEQPTPKASTEGPAVMFAHVPAKVRESLSPVQRSIGEALYQSMEATADLAGENAYGQRLIRERITRQMEVFSRGLTRRLGREGIVGWVGRVRFSNDGKQLVNRITFGDAYVPPEASGRAREGAGRVRLTVTYTLQAAAGLGGDVDLRDVREDQWLAVSGEFTASSLEAVRVACPLIGHSGTIRIPVGREDTLLHLATPGAPVPADVRQRVIAGSTAPGETPEAPVDEAPPAEPSEAPPAEPSEALANIDTTTTIDAESIDWDVPRSRTIDSLGDGHPMNDLCQLRLRAEMMDGRATLGFGVGPACVSRQSPVYSDYRERIGDAFTAALDEDRGARVREDFEQELGGTTYDRWYATRNEKIATVLITTQDGHAVCYWYIGEPSGWTAFRNVLGTATFRKP